MEHLNACPVCKHTSLKKSLVCTDYTVSKENFELTDCQNCGFRFTNPRPEAQDIGRYYQSEEYISHSDTNKGLISKAYQTVRQITLRSKLNLINEINGGKAGNLLDIGCGTGYFLQTCKNAGWKVAGVEPDDNARRLAESQTGIKIETDFLQAQYPEGFDVITMWHVLEHVHKLDENLDKLKKLIGKNGYLVIAVPNHASYDAEKYGNQWAAYDVPRHLYHFTPSTMSLLAKKHKLKVVKQEGMKFDAFYVAMLSEKYKNGSISYLNALSTGLASNQKAASTGLYSSVIYVLQNI
jgi:2-polyprenyl-3-methyl-5-hydroxy-6-metoxy-1,4-benzoquinol methylase